MDTKTKLRFIIKTANVYIRYKLRRYTPFALYLPITYRCNLKCNFCNVWKYHSKKELGLSKIYEIIDDTKRIGIPYISVFGGEPLLRKDLQLIGKAIQKSGIVAALTTNGTLINKYRAKSLLDSFDIIKISFTGLKKTHEINTGIKNSYKRTVNGLNSLIKFTNKKIQIIIHFVINKNNLNEIEDFIKEFKDKVNLICLLPENRPGSIFDDTSFYNKWKEIKGKYNIGDSNYFIENLNSKDEICDAGKLYLTIHPNGDVNACNVHQKLIMGNIHDRSFYEIYKSGISPEIKKRIKNCDGCYMKCTTEISQIFRIPFYKLIFNLPTLMRTYRI